MAGTYLPYIVVEAFCILYAAVMVSHLQTEVEEARELAILKRMIAVYIVMLAADIVCVFTERIFLSSSHAVSAVFNGVALAAVALGCYSWYQFVELRLGPAVPRGRRAERLIRLPLALICALDLVSVFTGWVFYIGADGAYMLGKLFWMQSAVTFAYLLIPAAHAVYKGIRTHAPQKRREYMTYAAYICVCIAAVTVEDSVPAVPLFALCIFAVIQIMFLTLYLDHEYALTKKERKLTEAHVAVMLSQLQPHFLFNALTAIQDLCHGKAPEAEQAVVEFAEYLRGNINSLRYREPIPFRQELEHTKDYLALESRRFPGRIRVIYDIRTEAFSIPVLTLQPLVENAVRYGITQRVEGGTVRISAEEKDGLYLVTVRDDGVGFDTDAPRPDGRDHIGLKSVRARLAEMCGGSLSVASTPGEGTVAVIAIPQNGGMTK